MNDSEHYVPPPPPYEHSLQHDHKVTDEAQALEVSKGSPFQEEEKDSKHSLSDKTPSDLHPIIPKSAGALRGPRPLPPRPEGARQLRPRRKYGSVADLKSYPAWDVDHAIVEPHTPVPPSLSAMAPSREKASQTKHHPSTSVPSPLQYSYQPSRDIPRRNNRWPVSSYYPIEPYAEVTSLERPAHMPSLLPQYLPRQNESRLSFDPSVAYSGSQANTRVLQREVAASLYRSVAFDSRRLLI